MTGTNGSVAGDSAIGRANLDGTQVIARFITGASSPDGVAVDGTTPGGVQDTTPPETTTPDGQITSSNQKRCQALPAKIFFFHFSEIHD